MHALDKTQKLYTMKCQNMGTYKKMHNIYRILWINKEKKYRNSFLKQVLKIVFHVL